MNNERDPKPSGRGVYSALPEYPGLPSKTGRTTAIIVRRPKRTPKPPRPPEERDEEPAGDSESQKE